MDKSIKQIIDKIPFDLSFVAEQDNITEIRLRAGHNISVVNNGCMEELNSTSISQKQIEKILMEFCDYTLSAYEKSISHGFITVAGGHRIGIGGRYYSVNNSYFIKEILSLNIRLNRKKKYIIDENITDFSKGLLVVGPPHSGKTTFLKSIIPYLKGITVICDEREELYMPDFNCDYISGIPKAIALEQATRCLNPDNIICDEIGNINEVSRILSGINTGVKFICSVHGENEHDIYRKINIKPLLDNNVFDKIIYLTQSNGQFFIKEISDV